MTPHVAEELGEMLALAGGIAREKWPAYREDLTREEQIEVIHEALLGAWPRLVSWRREDADGARFRDQLRVAARQWEERGRPAGLLWRGSHKLAASNPVGSLRAA